VRGQLVPPDATASGEPACRGSLTLNAPLLATTFEGGANGRSVPGRLGAATARFPGRCAIGFDAYCLGDPVQDQLSSDWVEPRWLRVHRNRGWQHTVSRLISGEPDGELFVAGGIVLPQQGVEYFDLERLAYDDCGPQARQPPGPISLNPGDDHSPEEGLTFDLRSEHAVNYGLAVYIESLHPEDRYQQVTSGVTPAVTWKYAVLALRLRTQVSRVVVLATPCIALNIPADAATVAQSTYELSRHGALRGPLEDVTVPVDQSRLQRTACLTKS
jgi:hypothetical protein